MRNKVNVYENEWRQGPVIARVEYNERLDHWNGSNWSDGGVGTHLGVTQLRDGRFVLIHGTQWQGQRDWAKVVSDSEALQAIIKSGNIDILDEAKFSKLKDLADKALIAEMVQ
ncbi:hypothetical protein KIH86_02925 [Paenibacillus sp. HN-1]|uniref:hypothetical protein n=1 Tax=Paenibacillus TaxID=44249 RepID=UPI001CA9167D|nr:MULTISPECIES: hypothetical protein [Paenibacillus]MBY9080973.1 hypothetical protein [Paenibacillus sp. CGMCC 1.18879]MBY9083185.1 hypothetical protein [Paenibacillus sinensis]